MRNTSCARAKAFCKALCCKWCFSHPFEHSGFVTSVSPHRAAPAASRCWLVTSSRTARLFNPQLHELATAVGCMMRPPEGNSITLLLAVLGYVTVCAWPPIHSIGNTMGRHICLGTIATRATTRKKRSLMEQILMHVTMVSLVTSASDTTAEIDSEPARRPMQQLCSKARDLGHAQRFSYAILCHGRFSCNETAPSGLGSPGRPPVLLLSHASFCPSP